MSRPRKPQRNGKPEVLARRKRNASASFLDETPVPYLLLDSSGIIVGANPPAAHLLGNEQDRLRGLPLREFISEADQGKLDRHLDQCRCSEQKVMTELRLRVGQTPVVELVTSSSTSTRSKRILLHMVIHEKSMNGTGSPAAKSGEAEIQKLNRTLKAMSESSQAMMRSADEAEYMSEVCKIVQQDCGHAMVWIGFAHDDEGKSVIPAAHAGFDKGYLEMLRLTWADTERGRGPTGTAIRTGRPVICRDMQTDPHFAPWRQEAIRRGYAASIALPLTNDGKTFGAITIYSREPDPFSEDEVKLLSELAGNLSYGLTALRLRAAHEVAGQALRESEERYRALFENLTEGFALYEILTDPNGQPCDCRFLQVNPGFERLTGLKRDAVIGKRMREVVPDIEPFWIEHCGKVALTGEPAHFERYSRSLGRWYEVFAYRPAAMQFAVTFVDISERKQAEQEHREVEERVRRKLESVLEPEGDLGVLELGDVIDVPAFQKLMDDFYAVSHFPMSVVDIKGRVLAGVGWQEICTRFHRVNPETCKLCTDSDTQLSAGVARGKFRQYKCKNNLWDIATPIIVADRQIGNVFSGQFFFEDETVDREAFRAQARHYHFDEEQYLAALDRVPRFSRKAVENGMAFLLKLADTLSQLGFSNAKLARSLAERNRLAASLQEEKERMKRAQEIAHLGSWELDHTSGSLTWSDEVYRIFGLEADRPIATYASFLEHVHPDDRAAVDTAYVGSLQEMRDSYDIEHRVINVSSGEIRFVHERFHHIRDDSGKPLRSIGMVHDVTEKKRAEMELRESQMKYQALIETTGDFIWEMDSHGRYTYCSPQMEKLWGLKPEAMIGKTPFDVMPEESKNKASESFAGYMRSPRPFSGLETAAYDGQGRLTYVETGGVPFFDKDGALAGFRGITRDITERKQAAEALRLSEEKFASAFANNPAAIALTRLDDGTFFDVNDTWTTLLGYSREEVIASSARTIGLWPTQEAAAHFVRELKENGSLHGLEQEFRRKSGEIIVTQVSAQLLSVQGENLILSTVVDITERKRAEKEFKRSTERFALLSETAGALLASTNPQAVIDNLCQKVMTHLSCDIFFNFLVDQDAQRLRLNACGGVAAEDLPRVQWIDYGTAVCGCVARDCQRIIVSDIQHAQDQRTEMVRSFGVQAYCCHPLMAGDRVLGTLSFGSRSRPQFTADEVELMRVVADQVSVALERLRTEKALRESEERMQDALRVSRSFAFEWVPAADRVHRSQSCAALLGLTGREAEEDTGQQFFQRLDPRDREKFTSTVHGLTPQADQYETKYRFLRPDGGITVLEESGRGFFDADGKLLRLIGVTTDVTARERAEEALRELNAQLEQRVQDRTAALEKTTRALNAERQRFIDVLDVLPAYVILLSPDYRVPFANRYFEERFGKSLGRRCYEYLFNRTEPCEVCDTMKALKLNAPVKWEWTGPDGRIYDISDFPFTDTDGSTLVLEMGIDITERKRAEAELEQHRHHLEDLVKERTSQLSVANLQLQSEITERREAEEALQESEERFRLAIQHSKLMAWQCDTHMRFTWVYNSHFGLSNDQLLGKTPAELGHERAMAEFIAHGNEVLTHGKGTRKTIRHVYADNREQYFDQQVETVRDAAGNIVGLIGISLDVTERVLVEQRLHKSEESFRLMVAHSVEPMLLVDESGKIECISTKAAEQLGYDEHDLAGTNVERFLDWSGKLDLMMRLDDFMRHAPVPARGVLRVRNGSGTWCWIDLQANFVNYGQRPEKYVLKFTLINTDLQKQ